MNLNANNNDNNVPLIKDAWSADKSTRNARLNINKEIVWIQLILVCISYIILLSGAALSVYKKTNFVSWGGLLDRKSQTTTENYSLYDSEWLVVGIILLIGLGISFLIFILRYNRHPSILDSIGLASPMIGFAAMLISIIIQSYHNTDGISYGGSTAATTESVGPSVAFIVLMLLVLGYIVLYVKNIKERTSAKPLNEENSTKSN